MPWDRAPLNALETAAYKVMLERNQQVSGVPGPKYVSRTLGCSYTAARGATRALVEKGWLGEAGDTRQVLYINDRPADIDD